MHVEKIGDWDQVKALLAGNLGAKLAAALREANLRNAVFLVREIKRGIRSQAPGGQQFVKLAQGTIDAKGSSKALIDTGFLMNSVTMKLMPDHAYVGLLASAANKDGDSLAMIGAIMEYGATIQHPSGATIIIPPRPFLHPVMEKYRPQVIENYRRAIEKVMGGE